MRKKLWKPWKLVLHGKEFFVVVGIILLLAAAKFMLWRLFKERRPRTVDIEVYDKEMNASCVETHELPPVDWPGLFDMVAVWRKSLRKTKPVP